MEKKWKARNIRKDKSLFLSELEKVKPRLPKNYAVIIFSNMRKKGISLKITHIRTVKAGKAVNWEILSEMKEICL